MSITFQWPGVVKLVPTTTIKAAEDNSLAGVSWGHFTLDWVRASETWPWQGSALSGHGGQDICNLQLGHYLR